MLTDEQQLAGKGRLDAGKLTPDDAADLLAVFRRWLAQRAGDYPQLEARLASVEGPVAEKLAGVLIELKRLGASMSKLGGGLPVSENKDDKRRLWVEYAFGLLYSLPGLGPRGGRTSDGSRSTRTRVVY